MFLQHHFCSYERNRRLNWMALIDSGYEWRFFAPFPSKWTLLTLWRLSAAPPHPGQRLMHQDQLCQTVAPLQPRKTHLTPAQHALQRVNLQ